MSIIPRWASRTRIISRAGDPTRFIYALLGTIILILCALLAWALLRPPTIVNNWTVVNTPSELMTPLPRPVLPLNPQPKTTPRLEQASQPKPPVAPAQPRPALNVIPPAAPAQPRPAVNPVPERPSVQQAVHPQPAIQQAIRPQPAIQQGPRPLNPAPPAPPRLSTPQPSVQQPAPAPATNPLSGKPVVEMVFVVDVTGSMGGLIETAKAQVWSIINHVQAARSHPIVRVGLVAYRDHGDDFVTRDFPITSDLDAAYSNLMSFEASGGGDIPEDVRQALSDGLHKVGWSTNPRTARFMFLVGDAPPHDDYTDEPDTLSTAADAARQGIIINTIQCGNASDTRASWQAIASQGRGEYFDIPEDGGLQLSTTPYDNQLKELAAQLGATYIPYGGGAGTPGREYRDHIRAQVFETEQQIAGTAPIAAQADRAVNKALNQLAYQGDLLQNLENGTLTMRTMHAVDLPESLQTLTPTDLRRTLEQRLAERRRLRDAILELSNQRDAYRISQHQRISRELNLDTAVDAAIQRELAARGMRV